MHSFNHHLTEYISNNFAYDAASIHWVLLSNGGADLHDSVILFCLVGGQRTPQFVVKVPRLKESQWALQAEYDSLKILWDLLGESAAFRLPRPVALVKFEDQPALIISHVSGENLLRASNRAFWMDGDNARALFVDAAASLREIFDASLTPLDVGEFAASDFSQKAAKFKELYPLGPQQLQMVEGLLARLAANAAEAKHKVFIQGDFWHGNIIRGQEHGQLMFVDWQYARWTTDVSLDVFLFLLAAALAAATNASPEKKAASAVDVLLTWKLDVIPAYLDVFRAASQYSMLPTRDGMLLCCIEKAVRAGMDFGHAQRDDVIWWWIFDALTKRWLDEN
jgi:aminoglycoside phosphotransferase (APT) family kinase protein